MAGNENAPALTVYSVGVESAGDCYAVVQELLGQTIRDRIEVIIVAPTAEGLDPAQCDPFAAYRVIELAEMPMLGSAMAEAIRAAAAPLVVYAEEHTGLSEDWAERVVEAHAKGYQAVGFAMENANPGSLYSWAHLLGQFGDIVAPAVSGEKPFLAGHHVSYTRELLLGYGDLVDRVMEDESALFLDLRRRGIAMYLEADAVSQHVNVSTLRGLVDLEMCGQRSFATTRARVGRFPLWKRLAFAASMPLVPFLRLVRVWPDIRRVPGARQRMPQLLVPMFFMFCVGAIGEALGYLFGPGNSATHRLSAELERELFTGHAGGAWTKPRAETASLGRTSATDTPETAPPPQAHQPEPATPVASGASPR
ncbi:MAG: hypothetical protein AAGI54_00385 [Planctomycetota bacterium]